MDIYEQLKRDEGFREHIYVDETGNTTIGYGWDLTAGISQSTAEIVMKTQADDAALLLSSRLPWFPALEEARQGVLVNMCFNIGFKDLEEFTKMLTATAQGNWNLASQEMLNSAWAKEVGDRATRLAEQMRTGIWQ